MNTPPHPISPNATIALAIHGGAGNITPSNLPPNQEQAYRDALTQVLETGHALLCQGGHSLDVVEAAVRLLEDSPLFNAGKGACFTYEGRNELDASIMDGHTLQAGAVAGVTTIRNPISAARAVMERSPYVLLIGTGAESFAADQGLEIVEPEYFYTRRQYERWEKSHQAREESASLNGEKFGTVGAVALDSYGDLAAATSTGGMMNKRYGRVGDSPIIGAGTYANNATCAVSATGHGEHFLCNVVAYDIAALMEYKGLSVQDAAEEVVMHKLAQRRGEGGVIAIGKNGQVAMPFSSVGMYRGSITADGQMSVHMFK
ncbi:isoaspartyl peptidase [Abditibacteriota bacterium]|nr:isoaspartyl peptidase [Abditibacteriota bacterium]